MSFYLKRDIYLVMTTIQLKRCLRNEIDEFYFLKHVSLINLLAFILVIFGCCLLALNEYKKRKNQINFKDVMPFAIFFFVVFMLAFIKTIVSVEVYPLRKLEESHLLVQHLSVQEVVCIKKKLFFWVKIFGYIPLFWPVCLVLLIIALMKEKPLEFFLKDPNEKRPITTLDDSLSNDDQDSSTGPT